MKTSRRSQDEDYGTRGRKRPRSRSTPTIDFEKKENSYVVKRKSTRTRSGIKGGKIVLSRSEINQLKTSDNSQETSRTEETHRRGTKVNRPVRQSRPVVQCGEIYGGNLGCSRIDAQEKPSWEGKPVSLLSGRGRTDETGSRGEDRTQQQENREENYKKVNVEVNSQLRHARMTLEQKRAWRFVLRQRTGKIL